MTKFTERNEQKSGGEPSQSPPLISIIIPTYNRAHLIGETLDSILAQTYPHWECIVVDDGSTDHTDEVMAGYLQKDMRFQYVHRPLDRTKGANACRNYGFEMSKGEFINWFDDDDLMMEDRLLLMISELMESNCDFCLCLSINERTKTIFLENTEPPSENLFEHYVLGDFVFSTMVPLWKRKLILQTKGYDEELQRAQEFEYYARLLYENPKVSFKIVNKPLIFIRQTPNSIIDQFFKGERQQIVSYLLSLQRVINLDKNNYKIRNRIINLVLGMSRNFIGNQSITLSYLFLKFALKNKVNRSFKGSIYWSRFILLCLILTAAGRGGTRFKNYFEIPEKYY